jgi:CheY-like chemotaxis protein/MinD-like ATPase involved in chromosome partitioning or flagellar assembly
MSAKLLIVDDDLETLRLVGLMLQRQGFQIVAANNGTQAITLAQKEQPDMILLDVMMPDMDGYEVTRRLRQNPATSGILVLMFTAKSQVDDKVAGYNAGADDYLTKPIHPAELVARIKALLARGRSRMEATAPKARGYTIGVLSPKGGMGVSTLVLNLAIVIHQKTKADVLAAELRPGHGTWALELGFASPEGLNRLLTAKPQDINVSMVEEELLRTTFGIRLLMASVRKKDVELTANVAQMEAVLQTLPLLSPLVLLDIGDNLLHGFDKLIHYCQEIFVVTEPNPGSLAHTKILIEELNEKGFGKSKYLNLVVVNRVRADVTLSLTQMQEALGMSIAQVIPPTPEMAFQAALRNVPLIYVQPEGLLAQQLNHLASNILERVQV